MATNEIIDIDLSMTAKKSIRVNGDDSRILYLDTSDLTIMGRLESIYPRLNEMMSHLSSALPDSSASDEEQINQTVKALDDVDIEMRGLLDELFDANVSEICAPSGTMYDMYEGTFRWEHIIDVLMRLYENNLNKEYKLMKARLNKHTAKYTKK